MRLVLIDSRIDDITGISGSLTENTEYILFDYLTDTIASIRDKITNTYESVAIIQHNYKLPTYQLVSSSEYSEVVGLEIKDPNLETWKEYIGFLVWLKTEKGAEFIDLMACDLWADSNWRYMIETVRSRDGVYIRASLDTTGAGGNFVLESDGIDMVGVYFTEKILEYKYAFFYSGILTHKYRTFYNYTLPLSNPGTIKPSPYSSLLPNYTIPTITNVISVSANFAAIAVLRTDGTITVNGDANRGGVMPCGIVTQSDLTNISKLISSSDGFCVLKKNGTVVCWGLYNDGYGVADINTVNTINMINVNNVRSNLVNIVDIYSTGTMGFAALSNTGRVITWGRKSAGGDSSAVAAHLTSGVSKIYAGYGTMVALKTNGTAVIWSNTKSIAPSTFARNYKIIDVLLNGDAYPQYICEIPGIGIGIFAYDAGATASAIYTLPSGVTILRKQWSTYSTYAGCFLILSNKTIVHIKDGGTLGNIYDNAVDIDTNENSIAILYGNSTIVSAGNPGWGGSITHSVYGLWNGANTTNAFRLISSNNAYSLLKTDKTVVWWGIIGNIPSNVDVQNGTTYGFATRGYDNVITTGLYGNLIAGNIASIYTSYQGTLVFSRQNNQGVGIINGCSITYNTTITKPTSTNVYFETVGSPSGSSFGTSNLIPIEIPYSPKVTPYFVIINKATSISYYVSNPDYMAYEGRTYRLYYGATLIDTFIPTSDTHTYVFSNVTMTTIGKFTLEIFDYTMATPVSMDTFSLSVYNYDYLYSVAGTVNTSGSITPITLNSATFNRPGEIAFDSLNNMYIADTNNHVIRVVPAQNGTLYGVNVFVGNTYVVAGTGTSGTVITNGTSNLSCTLNSPYGVAFDSNDNMFISDTNNHVVRVIPKTGGSIYGVTTTANQSFIVAGTGMAGTTATLPTSFGVISNNSEGTNMMLSTSALGIAVSDDGTRMAFCISSIASVSPITIFFYRKYDGNSWSTNQDFTIQSATSFTPYATYVSMTPSGNRVVFGCASGPWYYSDWGTTSYGPLIVINASVNCRGICITADGTRVITFNDAAGSSTLRYATYTGSGFGASQSVASMTGTRTIACTRDGNRVVTCKYAAAEAPNLVSLYTWNGATYVSASTTADTTERAYRGFSFSADGHILFSASENSANIKYALWNGANYGVFADVPNTKPVLFNSVFHTTSSTTGATTLYSLTIGGYWYTTSISHPWSVNPINLKLNYPRGIAIDALNRLYIADTSNHIIKVILPTTMTPYQIYGRTLFPNTTYIIGTDGVSGSSANDVDASDNARLNSPYDIMVDSSQNLFISDSSNNVVRVVSNITGTIFNNTVVPNKMYIVAGNAAATSTSGVGSGILVSDSTVQLFSPRGLAVDENRNLFISDSGSHSIRVISNKTGTIGTTSTTKNFIYTLIGTLNTPYANGNPTTNILNSSSTLKSPSSCVYNSAEKSMYISDTGTHSVRQAVYYKLPSAPGSPIINSLIGGNTTLTLTYSAGDDGGSAITNYYYAIKDGTAPQSAYATIGSSPQTLSNLKNGNTYTISLIAQNSLGNSATSNATATPYTFPSTPTLTSIAGGNSSLTVTLNATISNGGNAITTYYYSTDNGSTYTSSSNDTSNPYTISGLTNGNTYTVKFITQNAAGNSSPSNALTSTPYTTPDKPIISSITGGNASLVVTLDSSVFNGGNTYTTYYYSINNGNTYTSTGGNITNPYTISSGLTNGNTYLVSFITRNFAGNSAASDPVSAIPLTFPGAPLIRTITPGNKTIDVSFGAPVSDGGSVITDYKYSLYPADSSYVSIGPVPRQFQLTDLSNGTQYTIYLKAFNSVGNTTIPSSATAIPRTFPDAPIINTLTPKNGAIDISFNAPTDNGGNAITNYWYSLYPDSSYNSMGAKPTTYTVSPLFNGTSYTIYVKATNAAGNTLIAANSTAIPRTIPTAPIITDVIPGNRTIDISFNAPSSDGGNAITDYRYSFFPDSSYVSIGPVPIQYQITDLSNGTSYKIYLKAYNAAGNTLIASNAVAIPRTVPDAPVIRATILKNMAIDISFGAPTNNGGNAITDYAYSFFSDSSYNSMGATPTTYTISNLFNGTSYTIYLKAYNAAGNTLVASNTTGIPRTVPSEPIITTFIPGNRTIDISFNSPSSDGGNAITEYKYSFFPDSSYVSIGPVPVQYQITDLSNGTSYKIYLKAYNAAGNTIVASNSSAIPRTVPGAPIVKATILKNTAIDISFGAPTNNGGNAITDYAYSFFSDSSYNSMGATPTTYTISNLFNGTSYTIYLKAYNAAGNTITASSVAAIPRTVPDAPIINTLIPKNTAIDISFGAPLIDGGNAITNYSYSLFPDSSYISMGATPTTYTVPNLYNGNTYTIYLKATNAAGNTLVASNATAIPRTVPGAPIIKAVTLKNTAIDISFGAPTSDGGNAITDYAYSFYLDSSYISVGSTPRVFPITDLSNGTSYTIYMKAYNASGNTLIASNTTAIPRTVPDAPIINKLIPKNGAIDISFSAPTVNGGNAITDYKYSFFPDSSYNSMGSTPTTYTVSDLSNGTMYTIYLKATNAAGNTLIASNAMTIPRTVPNAPIITTFIPGNRTIDLSFNAPSSDGGNTITNYAYSFFPDTSYNSIGSVPIQYQITDLSNGTSYKIYLKAYNAAGNTLIASNAVAIPRTVPDAPVIKATILKDTVVDISFGAPSNNGGNAITDYMYSLFPDSSYNSVGPTPRVFPITDLSNGTTYTIYMKATNAAGNTLIASNTTAIPRTVPTAPIITDVILGNTTIDISFNAPFSDGGNAITDYRYSFFPDTFYNNSVGSSPTRFQIPGLTNGNSYTIYMKAYNAAGNTLVASNTVAIPRTVPGAPRIMSTTIGNMIIDISFIAPVSNGGNAITNYWYSFYPDSSYGLIGPIPTIYRVSGLKNGTSYTIYLKASNDAGNTFVASNTTAIPKTFPGAPVINALTAGDQIVDISFSAPLDNGGNAITNYWYSFYPDSSYVSMGPTPRTYTVTGLTNGATYTFYLKATNTIGNTINPSNATISPLSIPGAPVIKATTPGNTTIDISFAAPINIGGSVITDYKYSFYPDSSYVSVGASPTVISLSNLNNGTPYTIYLKATNAAGDTAVASSTTVTPRTFPDAPIINRLIPKASAIDISFSAPAVNGGNAITDYKYSLFPDSSYNSMGSTPTTYTVSPLSNGTSYTIYVKATNAAGDTLIAANSTAIPRTVPGAPIITDIILGNTTIDISFNAPSSNGGNAITEYKYSLFPDTSYNLIGSSPTRFQIRYLSNGKPYTIYMKAYNAAGNTIVASNVVAIPRTVPDAPDIRAVTLNDSAIDISFGAPSDNGGNAITNYWYSLYQDSSYNSLGPIPRVFSITDLSNGKPYTIYMKASNAAGNTLIESNTTAIPRTVPDSPIINTLIPKASAIDISFSAPAFNGGNAITDYKYSLYPDSSYNSMGATPTTYTVSGLDNGNTYTIYLKATNAAGHTLIASNSSAIPRTVPGAPIIRAVTLKNTAIDISFGAPAFNGGNAITDYAYSFFTDSSYNSVGSIPRVFPITDLSNGISYTIYMKAYNGAGNTVLASNTTAIPRTVPDAPIINTLIPKNAAIDISFSAPAFNGGNAITDYKYSLFPDSSYNPMGATPTIYTVPNLFNGTSYTIYVKATNAAGNTLVASSKVAIPRTVPDAPIITDVILGNTTIDISFNAPSFDGGNAITNYAYSFFPDTSYNLIGSSPTRFQIRDLSNGKPYTIYLKAFNAAGNTTIASNTVAIPRTVPDAPIINRLVPKNGAIDISFSAPAFNGGNVITDYKYSFYPDSSYNSMGATPTTYTVTDLSNGTSYTIYVKATNAAGNTFVASSAIAIPRTVPSAPIMTTFIPGNRTIDISFNAPSFDGGNAITDYAYSFFPDSSYVSIGPVPIQYQIRDLSNGTPYTIYLKAYNAAGNTVTSSSSTAIPRTVPSAPQIKAVTLKDSAIDVSFGAPISDGGNAITEYAYSFFPDSAYNSMGASPTVYTIPGLTNGTSFTIYFKAFNAAGNTLIASNIIAIPRTVPGAPVIKAVTLKDSAIDISFGEPVSTGGNAITEYRYSFFPDSSYNPIGASPTTHTVPGLTNGISYKIYLKAYNAAGNTLIASNLVAIPRTVPDAPQIKPATFGNTFIDVSFGAPISDGGNAITNYWFSFFSDSSYNPMNTSSPTTYRVSGLRNGTSYTIYLKASNAAGNTVTASSVTAIPKTFPGAPIITAATPGNASVSITFSAPTNDGGNAITGYSYSYFSDSSYNPIGPSPTTFPIPGLNNGTSYTIYLKATNSVGSTINAARTTLTPRTVPTAPTIDTIIPIDSALQVSLLPPTNNGGSSITGYYYTVDGGTPVFGTTAVNTVFNIPGLVNGTSYSIAVLAENAAGLSVASASVLRVPYTLPNSPIVDNIVYDANTITLTLNEPSSGGNAITGYYYEIANGGLQYIGSVAGIYIIGGLTNSRNTTVYIYALNAAGYSAPFIILSQNVSDEPENVPNIIRFRSAFSNNLVYYKPGSLSTSGGGSGVTNARAVKLRT